MTYPNTLTSIFKTNKWTSNDDAITFGFTGDSIAIWKMNSSLGVVHHTADVLARSANQVRMKNVAHFHG